MYQLSSMPGHSFQSLMIQTCLKFWPQRLCWLNSHNKVNETASWGLQCWKPVTQAMKTCSTPNQCCLVAMEKRVPSHAATTKKVAKHDLQCAGGRLSSSPLQSVQRHPKQWLASCQNYLAQANRPTSGLSNHSGRLNEALQTTNYRNHPAEVRREPMNLAGLLTF